MASILSVFLYLGIFIWGLYLDANTTVTSRSKKKSGKLYVIVLYIFLCFGYMVGSDWRSYEDDFYHADFGDYTFDMAFQYLFFFGKIFIPDYFLFVGLLKMAYLYTLIKLFKLITPYWKSSLAMLMPISLCFILIDNPLRFMVALIAINISFYSFYVKRYVISIIFLIASVFFHSSCAFVIVLLFVSLSLSGKIGAIKCWLLIPTYFVVFIVTSNLDLIMNIAGWSTLLTMDALGSRDYSYYFEDISEDNVYAIGNLLKVVAFILITLFHKEDDRNNSFLYGMTIMSFFLDRFVVMVPAGMRLIIPLQYFYAIYLVTLLYQNKKYVLIVISILIISWVRNLWIDYRYIPYTNSISSIIFGHDPYQERIRYNYIEQKERIKN